MKFLKTYVVASFVVFLHFAGQVRTWTSSWNRFYLLWERSHGAVIIADTLLLGLVVAALARLVALAVRRLGVWWVRRLAEHLLPLALFSGVMATFPAFSLVNHPNLARLIWLVAAAALGFSVAHRASRLPQYSYNTCLLFSPVMVILVVQMMSWPGWPQESRRPEGSPAVESGAPPVVLLVFDEWSYARSVSDGEFRPHFKHLRALSHEAVVFHNALSPGPETLASLPRLLHQRECRLIKGRGRLFIEQGGERLPAPEAPSLFQQARERGYTGYFVGWFLPYTQLLGGQADHLSPYRGVPRGHSVVGEAAHTIYRSMGRWTDPASQRLFGILRDRLRPKFFKNLGQAMREETLGLVERLGPNSFAMFHLLWPHEPFIWNSDGTYRGPHDGNLPAGYERNLACLDAYVGQLVARMKQRQIFDSALLMITSDHAWREEPEPRFRPGQDWRQRVPLLIKLPRQTRHVAISEPFRTDRLGPLFRAVFAGQAETEPLLELLRQQVRGAVSDTQTPQEQG